MNSTLQVDMTQLKVSSGPHTLFRILDTLGIMAVVVNLYRYHAVAVCVDFNSAIYNRC